MTKTIKVKLPTMEEVNFEIIVTNEDLEIRGNAIASGDDDVDKKVEDELIERVNNGEVWAWASVEVCASWRGFKASDYLGACSYQDEKGFKEDGYYDDMKATAFEELTKQIEALEDKPVNHFFEMLDLEKCRELVKTAKEQKGMAILCAHYSINIQSKYNDCGEPEQMDWDFTDFEETLGVVLSVNDYDDLIADFTEDENEND